MRNSLALLILALIVGAAHAGPDDKWVAQFRATDPNDGHGMEFASFGTGAVSRMLLLDNPGDCAQLYWPDEGRRFRKDIRAPIAAGDTETWCLIVSAGASYAFGQIKLAGWNQSGTDFDLNGSIPVKLVVVNDPSWPAQGSYAAGSVLWEFDPNVNGTAPSPTYTRMLNWTGQQIDLNLVAGGGGGGTPTVTDEGTYSSGTSSLHASWSLSGAVEYQYAVGVSQQNLVVGWKSAGTATQATESGITLQSGASYHWFVKARMPDGSWSGVGASDGVVAAVACTIGEARTHLPGQPVYLANTTVVSTASDPAGLWVLSSDGVSAVKIGASWTANRGDRIDAAGVVSWTDGIPVLSTPESKRHVAGGPPAPWFLRNASLANDRTESLAYQGLNPVGILAVAVGEVTAIDAAANAFYIDDGSHLQDGLGPSGSQYVGLRVACKAGVSPPAVGARVRVTGVRTILKTTLANDAYVNGLPRSAGETVYVPVLATRDAGDVVPIAP